MAKPERQCDRLGRRVLRAVLLPLNALACADAVSIGARRLPKAR
jgi:hypothetical protein